MSPAHQPVALETAVGPIAAMVTEPSGPSNGIGVVFFSPGGYTISAQRNRWAARFAEELALSGFHTIRFDYRGIGDSTGDIGQFEQAKPLIEEGGAAVEELRRRGVENLVLAGQCFGGRTAMAVSKDLAGLVGVFAISPPVRDIARGEGTASRMAHSAGMGDYLKKAASVFDIKALRDPAVRRRYVRMASMFLKARFTRLARKMRLIKEDLTPWVSRGLIDQLHGLGDREIPVQFVYGDAEDDSTDYLAAKAGSLGPSVASARLTETILPGHVHNLGSVAVQDQIIRLIVAFALGCADETQSG